MLNRRDVTLIRELAARTAEIAALPVQAEKRRLWRKLNALVPERPMVSIDEVCWNEMDTGELVLCCSDPECRAYEQTLRRTLFQWKYFPVDMVVESFVPVPKAIVNTWFGIQVEENTVTTDPANEVIGHRYFNQFCTEEDLEKLCIPQVSHDQAETDRRMAVAHELFDGLLEVRLWGGDYSYSLWDPIATWMGVENVLYALIDKPDYMHRLVGRMTAGFLSMIDQLEAQGLLCEPQSLIHCSGAYTDELPAPGYNPEKPRSQDIWMYTMAQMFSSVSPRMFKEFEVDYISQICSRFGQVYYGCCDPLDRKMREVRLIPNVRKVSMSTWVDQEIGAREIGGDYVFSRKPSPAMLAGENFDPEQVRQDLLSTRQTCEKHGCPLEFVLKDISTVRSEPERLFQWARVAMDVVGG